MWKNKQAKKKKKLSVQCDGWLREREIEILVSSSIEESRSERRSKYRSANSKSQINEFKREREVGRVRTKELPRRKLSFRNFFFLYNFRRVRTDINNPILVPALALGYWAKPESDPELGQHDFYLSKSRRVRFGSHGIGFRCHTYVLW